MVISESNEASQYDSHPLLDIAPMQPRRLQKALNNESNVTLIVDDEISRFMKKDTSQVLSRFQTQNGPPA
jgi:hypothetical protein